MGYTTNFMGQFDFSAPLSVSQKSQLDEFAEQRHGGNTEEFPGMPSFYCQWTPNSDGTALEWDGGEKFYEYVAWLEYLIKNFFEPWGIKLNGSVNWRGEEWSDTGTINVTDNEVEVIQ